MAEFNTFREAAPIHLNITFANCGEAERLLLELMDEEGYRGDCWSESANEFFAALKDASEPPHLH